MPGPEVLDEHVGVVDEAQHEVAIGVVLEVGDDRALVAVGQLPPQPLAVALVAATPSWRRLSPPGRSTLITSAPKSAR